MERHIAGYGVRCIWALMRNPANPRHFRVIEVTDNHQSDAQMLPSLLAQIPADKPIAYVSGDGAFDTKVCHEAIAARGATGCTPFRNNARPWKGILLGVLARNEILRATKRLGRAIWKRWSGYQPQPCGNQDVLLAERVIGASMVKWENYKCVLPS